MDGWIGWNQLSTVLLRLLRASSCSSLQKRSKDRLPHCEASTVPDVVAPEVQKSSWWWGKATKVPKTSVADEENANKLLTEVVVVRDPPLVQVFRVEFVDVGEERWCLPPTPLGVSMSTQMVNRV